MTERSLVVAHDIRSYEIPRCITPNTSFFLLVPQWPISSQTACGIQISAQIPLTTFGELARCLAFRGEREAETWRKRSMPFLSIERLSL